MGALRGPYGVQVITRYHGNPAERDPRKSSPKGQTEVLKTHYSPDIAPFQLCRSAGYFDGVQPRSVQMIWGVGLPSAILGRETVVRNRVIAANASISRFTVVLLCERIRTVIHCKRRKCFLYLVQFRCLFGNRKFDETEIRSRGL